MNGHSLEPIVKDVLIAIARITTLRASRRCRILAATAWRRSSDDQVMTRPRSDALLCRRRRASLRVSSRRAPHAVRGRLQMLVAPVSELGEDFLSPSLPFAF